MSNSRILNNNLMLSIFEGNIKSLGFHLKVQLNVLILLEIQVCKT